MLEWQSRHLQWFDFFIQGKGPKPVPAMTSPFDYQDDLRAIQDKSIENRKGFGRPASGVRKPGDSGVDDDLDLSKRACGSADDCRHDVSFARVAASRNRGLGGSKGIPDQGGTCGRFRAGRKALGERGEGSSKHRRGRRSETKRTHKHTRQPTQWTPGGRF